MKKYLIFLGKGYKNTWSLVKIIMVVMIICDAILAKVANRLARRIVVKSRKEDARTMIIFDAAESLAF